MLSNVQLEIFDGWRRPDEALSPPKSRESKSPAEGGPIMMAEHDIDLIQDVTTDCSVVASLCAGTARASHGHSRVNLIQWLHLLSSNGILGHLVCILSIRS